MQIDDGADFYHTLHIDVILHIAYAFHVLYDMHIPYSIFHIRLLLQHLARALDVKKSQCGRRIRRRWWRMRRKSEKTVADLA
jgi:hypothetical protein